MHPALEWDLLLSRPFLPPLPSSICPQIERNSWHKVHREHGPLWRFPAASLPLALPSEWAPCQQAAGIRGMLNCRAVLLGGLIRHMTHRQSNSPKGQPRLPKWGPCSGQQGGRRTAFLTLSTSYFSLRKTRVQSVSDRLSLHRQKMGPGDG